MVFLRCIGWAWDSVFSDTDCLSIFVVVLVMVRCWQIYSTNKTLPPGPWGLPFIGYLPFFKGDAHLHYKELSDKYGPIFSTKLGNQLIVVLSDFETIRDAFRKEEFTGRPQSEFSDILGGYGVINIDGKLWKDQRRFLHERLRRLGMTFAEGGKVTMEKRIEKEVQMFLSTLCDKKDTPQDLNPIFSITISNVICSIIMSVRFTLDDPRFTRFMSLISEGFRLFARMTYVNFIPIMKHLPGLQETRKKIDQNRYEMSMFFQETVDNHRVTYKPNKIRDLVDNYLEEIEERTSEGTAPMFNGKDPDRQLQQVIGDLFSAGMETIKTTLQWAVIFMMHNPDVAKAVQNELDIIVGRKRLPNLNDRDFLPYTESVILEVLRRSSVVPLGTTHACTRDVDLGGFRIPKGTQIVPLLHAVHMDPKLWKDPDQFCPERFLTDEGKVHKPDFFMPFGVGRRMCLGDVLARMELFLFFSSLMHCFDLKVPEGEALPSLECQPGITLSPQNFKVRLHQRFLEDCELKFLTKDDTSSTRNCGSN